MKKILKLLLIIGLALTVAGGGIFVVAFASSGWNADSLSNVRLEEKRYTEENEHIETLNVVYKNADILVEFNADVESVTVDYPIRLSKKGNTVSPVSVTTENGELCITEHWQRFGLIAWDFTKPQVKIHLPAERTYGLSLQTDNGDITFSGGACTLSSLFLETDNGDINTENASLVCDTGVQIETDNGDVRLGAFTAEKLAVSTDNGDIYVTECTASEFIELETDNGDIHVNGNLQADRITLATDVGAILARNGILDAPTVILTTDVGDITATLAGNRSDYITTVEHDVGDTNIHSNSGEAPTSDKILKLTADVGDITVTFQGN